MADEPKFAVLDPQRIGLGRAFAFEAGHTLEGYDGKCATPHGHSYKGHVLISAARSHADEIGIVVDFDVLKRAIHDCIFKVYDHRTLTMTAEKLVNEMAVGLQSWFKVHGGTTLSMQHEDQGLKLRTVPSGIELERIKLYETANCFVEWHRRGF